MDLAASTTSSVGVTDQVPRIVHTRSGSRYRIEGGTVIKLTGKAPGTAFELVDVHANRLRYTDGARLYISTPLIAA